MDKWYRCKTPEERLARKRANYKKSIAKVQADPVRSEQYRKKKADYGKLHQARANELARKRWASGDADSRRAFAKSDYGKQYLKRANAAWRKAHPDADRKQYAKHRDKRRAAALERIRRDPSRSKKRLAAYWKNPDAYRARGKRWRDNNPGKYRQSYQARIARKKAATIEDCAKKIAILNKSRFCHWCCAPLTKLNRQLDHVTPLNRGGKHCADNLVSACGHCNASKRDRLPGVEWTWRKHDALELMEAA